MDGVNHRAAAADRRETIDDAGGHAHQLVVDLPEEHLLQLAERLRLRALVVEHQLDVPLHHRIVDGHPRVQVPALDDSRIDHRKIDLAERVEVRVGGAQHPHHHPAFVLNAQQRMDFNAFDHQLRSWVVSPALK
jgi:hypothetical protein